MLLCLAAVTPDRVLFPSFFTAAVKLFCFVSGFPVTAVVSYLDHTFFVACRDLTANRSCCLHLSSIQRPARLKPCFCVTFPPTGYSSKRVQSPGSKSNDTLSGISSIEPSKHSSSSHSLASVRVCQVGWEQTRCGVTGGQALIKLNSDGLELSGAGVHLKSEHPEVYPVSSATEGLVWDVAVIPRGSPCPPQV